MTFRQPGLKWVRQLFRRLPWVLASLPCAAFGQWVDTFDTINPAWVTDRYALAGFQSVSFLGDNRLQITIDQTGSSLNRPSADSSSFYNTQGDQRPVGIIGDWSLSAEVYVSSAFDTSTGQLVRSDLSAHTSTSPGNGDYAIIGFTNASPSDPLNPDAPDRSFRFQIFDGTQTDPNSWFDVGVPAGFTFDAWHTLEASGNSTSIEFSIDGAVVYTDSAVDGADFQTAFIEAYNFGQTGPDGSNSYSVYWDNAVAAVPEPASFALAAALAALGMAWTRSRAVAEAPGAGNAGGQHRQGNAP